MSSPLVQLTEVSFAYQLKDTTFLALKNINLNIYAGEYIAIIGPSGSGKTTLMNLLGLMASPTQGKILLQDKDVSALPPDELASLRNTFLGFVFQNFHLLARATVAENVKLSANYCNTEYPEEHLTSILTMLGIPEQAEKPPTQLSGGQKQRTAIARALYNCPQIILADEPTGALDSKTTEAVLDIFANLHRQGNTIIVITHNPEVAAKAHRVIEIKDGIIFSDIKKSFYSQTIENKKLIIPQNLTPPFFQKLKHRTQDLFKKISLNTLVIVDSILANQIRSTLTILGLSVGIISIIIMITLTTEAKNTFNKFADSLGANKGFVQFDGREAQKLGQNRWRGLHLQAEFPAIEKLFAGYGKIEPSLDTGKTCNVTSNTEFVQLDISAAINSSTFKRYDAKLAQGREFTQMEYANGETLPIAVLGEKSAKYLFPARDPGYATKINYPLNEVIYFTGCSYYGAAKVVGILKNMESDFGLDINNQIFIPSSILIKRGIKPYSNFFVLTPNPQYTTGQFAESFTNYLKLYSNNKFPFRFFTAEEQLGRINTMMTVFQAITLLIGALCIIIGGIGIMNIMLVSITERIKEIGIRKAVGAKEKHIRNQFLQESCIFCLTSGFVGVVFGIGICNGVIYAASILVPKYVVYSFSINTLAVIIALFTSVLSGLIFGLLPAKKAAKMDIVEALRSD